MAVAGTAKKRRWWWAQPPRTDTPVLSTRRAYTEVLVVFGTFFASGIVAAAFSVAGHTPTSPPAGWSEAVPASIDQVAITVLCVLVPLLLSARRSLRPGDLGLHRPGTPGAITLAPGIRMAAWALLGLIGGGAVTALLATGRFPVGKFSYPNLTLNLFHAAQAGFIEEIVVLAFVVTTLEQARRPRSEIVAVALLLRASYHIYYGAGVFGIFVWASIFLWLFLRFRTIVPLIAVHSGWDLLAFLGQHWRWVEGVEVLSWFALLLSAFIVWLSTRSSAPVPPLLATPGWYPDPSGQENLRWFDGWRWTPAARPR